MPKIYTIPRGLVVHISGWGPAGNDEPAIVPDAVAAELDGDDRLRVVREETAPAPPAPTEEPKKRARRAQEE
jgi:hypothetical protein